LRLFAPPPPEISPGRPDETGLGSASKSRPARSLRVYRGRQCARGPQDGLDLRGKGGAADKVSRTWPHGAGSRHAGAAGASPLLSHLPNPKGYGADSPASAHLKAMASRTSYPTLTPWSPVSRCVTRPPPACHFAYRLAILAVARPAGQFFPSEACFGA